MQEGLIGSEEFVKYVILNLKDEGFDIASWNPYGTMMEGRGPFSPGVPKSEVFEKVINNEELSSFLKICNQCGFVLCEEEIYLTDHDLYFKEQKPIVVGLKVNDSHSLLNGKTCIYLYIPTFDTFIKNKEKNSSFGEGSPKRFKEYYKQLMRGYHLSESVLSQRYYKNLNNH